MVAVAQLILSAVITLLLWFYSYETQAFNFAVGSLVMLALYFSNALVLEWVFKKKHVALALLVIVCKYAILAVIIYRLVRLNQLDPLFFAMGVLSFQLVVLILAKKLISQDESKDESLK